MKNNDKLVQHGQIKFLKTLTLQLRRMATIEKFSTSAKSFTKYKSLILSQMRRVPKETAFSSLKQGLDYLEFSHTLMNMFKN